MANVCTWPPWAESIFCTIKLAEYQPSSAVGQALSASADQALSIADLMNRAGRFVFKMALTVCHFYFLGRLAKLSGRFRYEASSSLILSGLSVCIWLLLTVTISLHLAGDPSVGTPAGAFFQAMFGTEAQELIVCT